MEKNKSNFETEKLVLWWLKVSIEGVYSLTEI